MKTEMEQNARLASYCESALTGEMEGGGRREGRRKEKMGNGRGREGRMGGGREGETKGREGVSE